GALPAAGQWTLLQVPASQVGLEGSTLTGMSFSQFDGRATWDYAGKGSTNAAPSTGSTNTVTPTNAPPVASTNSGTLTNTSVWVDDSLPVGAIPGTERDTWSWVNNNP